MLLSLSFVMFWFSSVSLHLSLRFPVRNFRRSFFTDWCEFLNLYILLGHCKFHLHLSCKSCIVKLFIPRWSETFTFLWSPWSLIICMKIIADFRPYLESRDCGSTRWLLMTFDAWEPFSWKGALRRHLFRHHYKLQHPQDKFEAG